MKNRIIALVVGMLLLLVSSLLAQAPDTLRTKTRCGSAREYDSYLDRLQYRNPTIEVIPDSLVFTVTDSTVIGIYGFMYVKNVGIQDTLAIDSITWIEQWVLYVSPDNFSVAPGDSQEVMSLYNVDTLPNGIYDDNLMIFSNDTTCPIYYEPVRIIMAIPGVEEENLMPKSKNIRSCCHPNPFTTVAKLNVLGASKNQKNILTIYDALGRRVREISLLPSCPVREGCSNGVSFYLGAIWDGRDENGKILPPGIYFLKADGTPVGKVVKVR